MFRGKQFTMLRHAVISSLLMIQYAVAQYNMPANPSPPSSYPSPSYPSPSPGNYMPQSSEMPQVNALEVSCGDNQFRVHVAFNGNFNGVIFAKGYYSNSDCVYVRPGSNLNQFNFIVGYNQCGSNGGSGESSGGTGGGYPSPPSPYGGGGSPPSGGNQPGSVPRFFETTIIIQYDPNIQEKWDVSRVLRCEWYNSYEKVVTFKPFNVEMVDIVRASFVGDNIGAWMQIQQGKGPWAGEVNGIVKIGDIITVVVGIQDPKKEFDLIVKNCMANSGNSAPIMLVNEEGCILRSKLMGPFQKTTNFGSSASVVAYSYLQAFKFPDTMEVHLQCTIQVCRGSCPPMCASQSGGNPGNTGSVPYPTLPSPNAPAPYPPVPDTNQPIPAPNPAPYPAPYPVQPPPYPAPYPNQPGPYPPVGTPRSIDGKYVTNSSNSSSTVKPSRRKRATEEDPGHVIQGLKRVIRVVSLNDLSFSLDSANNNTMILAREMDDGSLICMSTPGFAVGLVFLLALLIVACLITVVLFVRIKSQESAKTKTVESYDNLKYTKQ